jgi:hypothetical protein
MRLVSKARLLERFQRKTFLDICVELRRSKYKNDTIFLRPKCMRSQQHQLLQARSTNGGLLTAVA